MADEDISQAVTAPRNDASLPVPGPPIPATARLAHFEVIELLGRGGFGDVYRARDTRLGRMVALKVLREEIATDALRERVRREAIAASALNHPGICTVYDLLEVDGRDVIVMELVEGRPLRDVHPGGPRPAAESADLGAQIAAALGAAHRAGIVHRDVKPGNIMLTPEGRVKVLDFGLAKRIDTAGGARDTALTLEGVAMGTLSYMSPEQLLADKVDDRSDLFALGVVLYEMVAGRRPFQGASTIATADAILHSAPPPIGDPTVPRRFEAALGRLLEKEPGRRFATAQDVVAELRGIEADIARRARRRRARPVVALAVAAAVIAAVAGGWLLRRASRVRWAREARPEIARLVAAEEFTQAAALARAAQAVLPEDGTLAKLWEDATLEVSFDSVPRGADISYRGLRGGSPAWQSLGRTPLERVRVPKAYYLWRIEAQGFDATYQIWPTAWLLGTLDLRVRLDEHTHAPAGMVRVTAGSTGLRIPGLQTLPAVDLNDFWIDQHEVTNAEYSRFVDAGGYGRRELWTEPFVRDGRSVRWDEAMAAFRDSTGRPGPPTWELGRFPKGQESHPVAGVSWYEADAYSRFLGKRLPSIYHWSAAAQAGASHLIVPRSNFQGPATLPVGSALSGFGTSDMAGNVKEWCWNEAGGGRRYILGGGFGEPVYMFNEADAQSPWERRPNYGFRTVLLPSPPPSEALGPIATRFRDFGKERPASDEVFRAYKGLYLYDRTELDPSVEDVETTDEWRHEKVSFAAGYGRERVIAHLYLPRNAAPPYQTVVLFPGSGGMYADTYTPEHATFIPTTGRALLEPIYKGTFDRRDGLKSDYPEPTAFYRDHMIAWSRDLGRSLDYLETRPDIDRSRLAYMGTSWGATVAPVMLAVEERFRAAVLVAGGLPLQTALPEADALNFITRVTVPTLVLNGRYDHMLPEGPSQQTFFRLLGTAERDKRFVLYEAGHSVPRKEVMRESTDWLDHYLGPVQVQR